MRSWLPNVPGPRTLAPGIGDAAARRGGPPPLPIDPPCYFNTGCCSFGDGDVTGLEIADGRIRLVRWPNDDDEPAAKVLVSEDLRAVLAAVRG